MGLPVEDQIKWWGIALAALLVAIWMMGNLMLPFLVGASIAYFLDPLADRLEALGLSRALSTTLIMAGAVFGLSATILLIVPLFAQELQSLVQLAPSFVERVAERIMTRFPELNDEESILRRAFTYLEDNIRQGGLALAKNVLSSSIAVVEFIVLLVVAPVVAFYMLLDWDRMVAAVDDLLPREHAPVIRRLAREIDGVMGGFLRGQLLVCFILGAFYAVALEIGGLRFGLVVGLVGGLLSFIPYVGATLGGVLSIGLAIFQNSNGGGGEDALAVGGSVNLFVIAGIFVIGQVIEGYYLTPKLVGNSVGLHPVWLMFSLSAFGAFFGFVGLLIAVPAAASIGVLLRFAIQQYQSGRLYQGPPLAGEDPPSARAPDDDAA